MARIAVGRQAVDERGNRAADKAGADGGLRSDERERGPVVVKDEHGEPAIYHLGFNVAQALGYKWDDERGGLRVGGAGMDMGYHVVYSLSSVLFRDRAVCLGEKNCPSNDHFNGDRDYTKGKRHGDAGYQLKHQWL